MYTYIHIYIYTYIYIQICLVSSAMQFLNIFFGWIDGLPSHSEERRKKRAGSKRKGGERKKRSDAGWHGAIYFKFWFIVFGRTGWFTANTSCMWYWVVSRNSLYECFRRYPINQGQQRYLEQQQREAERRAAKGKGKDVFSVAPSGECVVVSEMQYEFYVGSSFKPLQAKDLGCVDPLVNLHS